METLVAVGAHFFGLVGMAGVWLVPSRLVQLIFHRSTGFPLQRDKRSAALAIAVSLAMAISLFVAVDAMPRVFRCLWEGWCTTTRGGGLLNLALFGVTVLLLEVTWHISSALTRRWYGNAAQFKRWAS